MSDTRTYSSEVVLIVAEVEVRARAAGDQVLADGIVWILAAGGERLALAERESERGARASLEKGRGTAVSRQASKLDLSPADNARSEAPSARLWALIDRLAADAELGRTVREQRRQFALQSSLERRKKMQAHWAAEDAEVEHLKSINPRISEREACRRAAEALGCPQRASAIRQRRRRGRERRGDNA